jgi:prepilin-type N-terminal cleavage/methylation domain-containing protein
MTPPAGMQRGFTLLELSIVLVLIGTITGMGLMTFTASTQASQYNKTVERMDAIDKALLSFVISNSRIPCPSDLTQVATSATYRLEAGAGAGSAIGVATGVCTGTGMLAEIAAEPISAWRRIEIEGVSRTYRTPRILDRKITLDDYAGPIRQLTITDLGHEEPTLLLTN